MASLTIGAGDITAAATSSGSGNGSGGIGTVRGEHATAEFLDDEPVVEARGGISSATSSSSSSNDSKMTRTISSAVVTASQPSSSSSSTRIQRHWARKHRRSQRYAHEHNKDPDWYRHSKHVFVFTWSGRPIFTLYGDETKMAAYMGVISAIISNFQRGGDDVRTLIAGDAKFVFLLKGTIYLVCMSRTPESVRTLKMQLTYVHEQIISVLTNRVDAILESRPQFDVRHLMGGTEGLMADLIHQSTRSPAFFLDSVNCLRMPRASRARVTQILRKAKSRSLLYSILLANKKLVALVKSKDKPLHPSDMHILINFVSNSQSLRSSESWTPICLPKFSDKGFLYSYVCYLSDEVCLLLITGDNNDFFNLKSCKAQIMEGLMKYNLMDEMHRSLEHHQFAVEDVDTGIPDLRHFIYKLDTNAQWVSPRPAPPFHTKAGQKELLYRYEHMHSRVHDSKGNKKLTVYFEVCASSAMLAWIRPGEFEMYSCFTPLITKDAAMSACNRALRWLKKEEPDLFA